MTMTNEDTAMTISPFSFAARNNLSDFADLALAIWYEAHYQVERFIAHDGGALKRPRSRRAWLDTGRDEVLADDLICEAFL